MNEKTRVAEIVDQMYFNDPFSLWLGIERIEEGLGYSKIKMTVRKEMLNGFGVAHGGISFSLADSAFAFACNSHGKHAVSIECSVNHVRPIFEGDVLTAEAKEISRTRTLGNYDVVVRNQKDVIVALFKGLVFVKDTNWK